MRKGDRINNKSIFSEEGTEEGLKKLDQLSNIFTLDDIMKNVSGEPQQTLYSLSIEPKKDAKKIDKETIKLILNRDNNDFDPQFIFKDCGMGRTTKRKVANKHYDIVILNKGDYPGIKEPTKTTLGRLLINKVIFSHARLDYMNVEFTGKIVEAIFTSLRDFIIAEKLTLQEFKKTLQIFEDFGFRMASFIAPSVDADMLRPNRILEEKKKELLEKYKDGLAANDVETSVKMENELIDLAKKLYSEEDFLEWYKSGSSGKMGYKNDFKVSQLMIGAIPKGLGTGEFHVSTSTFMKGINKDEIHVLADQSIVALHAKAQSTAIPGYAAKQGVAMFQTIYLDKFGSDCKTKKGVMVDVDQYIARQLVGSYLTDGTKLTSENIKKYIGKTIKVRNPFTCEHDSPCSVCAGELVYKLNNTQDRIPIGLELNGIYTELTQAALQKTHKMTAELEPIGDLNDYLI